MILDHYHTYWGWVILDDYKDGYGHVKQTNEGDYTEIRCIKAALWKRKRWVDAIYDSEPPLGTVHILKKITLSYF